MKTVNILKSIAIGIVLMAFNAPEKSIYNANPAKKEIAITDSVTKIIVSKEERKIYAYFGDTFKIYRCAFGANPVGHKQQEGDNRTPEGSYTINLKNPKSRGFKSLKISYPNATDIANAKAKGVKPGGDIFIHGLWWPTQDPNTHWLYDWTWGCIAINNTEILELFNWTRVGTPITIKPN